MENSILLANQLLSLLGGPDNIVSVTHCATRLRPTLKDHSLIEKDKIKALDGVSGVVDKDSFQIVIGLNVNEVYDVFIKVWKSDTSTDIVNTKDDVADTGNKKRNWFNEFVALVVSIFSPLLPLLAGAGLLRGFTILANELGWLSTESTTNLILTLAATSVFYFLPLLVAVTSAKRFDTSPYIAIAVMGALIMPEFIDLVQGDGGNTITFLGISIPVFNYTSQIIPAILTTWIQSKMEHYMKGKLSNSFHMIVIPTVLLVILVPITAGIIGPIGNYLSIGIANFVGWLANISPIVTGAVIGGIWNILIMFGVHWAPNTMVIIPEIASTGKSALIAYGANANFGMAGAAFAIFLLSRNKELKNFSLTAITSVFLSGIVEPAIYGLGVRFKSPLVAGCLGAALGGAFMGAFNVVGNAFVFGGLTTIPAFAGPTLWAYIVGIVISFLSGMVLTIIFGIKDPEAEMSTSKNK
ncbi:PTS system beta-glucosides-specific IIC component [Virgibacillus halotolerans]|uniref:PTS transporter subunit EIIC n=1 Tax=Virgibacillus halotolerans TaxID=1071053 RepID=UPI0019604CDF|nr:PTS transporter subunit EIIC [Virgibacillus halotolerans]MBM7601079.1 PTS system beta-glucosides-specific IIC component [Virgibacillus halotolerans]